jgi:hypothetical protein
MATKKFPPFLQATDWFSIVKSDTVNFADDAGNPQHYALATVFVGTTGDVNAVSANDTITVFKNIPSGTFLPLLCKRVNSAGTTASDMVAMVGISVV